MTQLSNSAKIPEVVASLQASEGINQRAELATAIGSPTVSTDAVGVQVVALQALKESLISLNNTADANNTTVKQNIVAALLTRGIASVATEAWSSLVSKLNKSSNCVAANIKSGVIIDGVAGIYLAKQTARGLVSYPGGTSSGTVSVTGLSFKPSSIIIYKSSASYDEMQGVFDITTGFNTIRHWNYATNTNASWTTLASNANGFTINYSNNVAVSNAVWIAIE